MTYSGHITTLLDMLTYKRPAGSDTERAFINKFIRPFDPWQDKFGNLIVQIGDDPNILWSSHTDTVHHQDGRQAVRMDGDFIVLDKPKAGTCLGADCAAGVWLMAEMIRAKVQGVYVFHRDEERGGGGSSWMARNTPNIFEGIEFAIALDRKGYDSVITHQGERTASDAFARSMAAILGGTYSPDDTGLFTDTAHYTELVGECTNLSVGYFDQHGPRERQDLPFIMALRDTLISADFSTLVQERMPGDLDEEFYFYQSAIRRRDPMVDWIEDNPHRVANYMRQLGWTMDQLEEFL